MRRRESRATARARRARVRARPSPRRLLSVSRNALAAANVARKSFLAPSSRLRRRARFRRTTCAAFQAARRRIRSRVVSARSYRLHLRANLDGESRRARGDEDERAELRRERFSVSRRGVRHRAPRRVRSSAAGAGAARAGGDVGDERARGGVDLVLVGEALRDALEALADADEVAGAERGGGAFHGVRVEGERAGRLRVVGRFMTLGGDQASRELRLRRGDEIVVERVEEEGVIAANPMDAGGGKVGEGTGGGVARNVTNRRGSGRGREGREGSGRRGGMERVVEG